MKNVRAKLGMGLLLSALMLTTGCGDKAIQLTEEEEDLIVDYAAHVVSKFNTRQPDGLAYVEVPEEETEEAEMEPEEEETAEENDGQYQDMPDEMDVDDEMEQTAEEMPQAIQATLTEALGMPGIDAFVASTELKPSYVEEDYFAMDASAGNTYLVVHVVLNNIGDTDVSCDMLAVAPQFSATVNGMESVPAETTVLLNDLSTYQGIIPAGGSEEEVLLFQVPADAVPQVNSLTLGLTMNGQSFTVPCM